MVYLYVKQQQSEKRRHLHLNENEWDVAGAMEIDLLKSRHMFYYILNAWGNCHPKAEKSLSIIQQNNTVHNFFIVWSPDSILIFSQQQKALPGIHFKVTARAAADLLQHWFNAAMTSNPTQVWYQNNCTKYVTSWAETVSTFL